MLAVVVKIDDVFGGAAMEAEGDEGGVQLGILGAGSLAKPVGGSTRIQVALPSIATISACIASRQQLCSLTSVSMASSSEHVRSRSSWNSCST
jgi:hypothetical protein